MNGRVEYRDTATLYHANSFEIAWAPQEHALLILDPNFEDWDSRAFTEHPAIAAVKNGFILTFSRAPRTFSIFEHLSKVAQFREHLIWHDPQPQWVSNELALKCTEDVLVFKVGSAKTNMKIGSVRDALEAQYKGRSSIGRWSQEDRIYKPNERAHLTTLITAPRNLTAPLGRWQKPDKLATMLIEAYAPEDAVVLDPFCGSGAFVYAASKLGKKAIGAELSADHYNYCLDRFRQGALEFL